jgi:hypothetical protein
MQDPEQKQDDRTQIVQEPLLQPFEAHADPNESSKIARVFASISDERARSIDRPTFAIDVGAKIPRRIRLYAMTKPMVEMFPQYRGHFFLVANDQVLIVQPRTNIVRAVVERR